MGFLRWRVTLGPEAHVLLATHLNANTKEVQRITVNQKDTDSLLAFLCCHTY